MSYNVRVAVSNTEIIGYYLESYRRFTVSNTEIIGYAQVQNYLSSRQYTVSKYFAQRVKSNFPPSMRGEILLLADGLQELLII